MSERGAWSLLEAPRWLLLITLFFAPWAYGCTVGWAMDLLNVLMGLIIGGWLLGRVVLGGEWHVPRLAFALVALLLGSGWAMAANAHFRCDPRQFAFTPVAPLLAFAPGSVDQATSIDTMWRLSGLLGVLLFVIEMARHATWRRRLWWTIGLTGTSLVFFGLLQRASGFSLFFPRYDPAQATFFGPYFYHGNAGAFINLVLPPIAGLLLLSLRKAVDDLGRLLWIPAVVLCLIAAAICHSRAALVVTVLASIALGSWTLRQLPRRPGRGQTAVYGVLIAVLVAAVIVAIGWRPPVEKWQLLGRQLNAENPRWLAATAGWQMARDAGAFGFGPGTFGLAFPHYTESLGTAIRGIWRHAHQDYLQTLIEWGWIGAALWALVWAGGLRLALKTLRNRELRSEDRTLLFCTLVALVGVALHALVDFPLQIASLQLYAATYLGMCWASPQWRPPSDFTR